MRERYAALVIDFGGVLTTSLRESFRKFCEHEGIEFERLRSLVRTSYQVNDPEDLVAKIETGRISVEEFERQLAEIFSEGMREPIVAEGLLARMSENLELEPAIIGVVRAAHDAGVKTALLSNSWGMDLYPNELLEELFDEIVISGQVGKRKPDAEVFHLAADGLEVEPTECVFVDDVRTNIEAAEAVGMRGVLHDDVDETVAQLEGLLGMRLREAGSDAVGRL
ncbi:MAG TPA: HAD family phosphatase [Actinomycetota bacterium]|nr:HAD family phosphatase [Actinomycetota bacterium]